MYLLSMMAKLPTILAWLPGWRHDCASTRPANDSFMKRWPLQFIHRRRGALQGPNEMEGVARNRAGMALDGAARPAPDL